MRTLGVWLDYQPALYQDLLNRCLDLLMPDGFIHIVDANRLLRNAGKTAPERIDVIILSLDDGSFPTTCRMPGKYPGALWLALSPRGDMGLKKLPDQVCWETLRPFGIHELAREINSFGRGS